MSIDLRNVLLFAGGDAISRYGVVVKRTAMWEEDPEVLTRAGTATFTDRDGSSRSATTDVLCVEWISGSPTLKLHETSTALSVNADRLYVPWTVPPIASAYYFRFKLTAGSTSQHGVFRAGSTSSTSGPALQAWFTVATPGTYDLVAQHRSTSAAVTSTATVSATTGQTLEVLVNLRADGSVRAKASVDGGADINGAASTANAVASTWSANKLWVASLGAEKDLAMNLYCMAAARSTQSMANMRLIG